MKNRNIRTAISISINLILVIVAVYILYGVGCKAFAFGESVFHERAVDSKEIAREVEVTIQAGKNSTSAVTDLLYEKGLIGDKLVFKVQVTLSEYKNKFIAGTYTLKTDMTPTEIMKLISTEPQTETAE